MVTFGKINLFVEKCFYHYKIQKRHHTVSEKKIQSDVLFEVLITNAPPCGYFSEKCLLYSLFVKRIIAIEAQLYFLGLVGL